MTRSIHSDISEWNKREGEGKKLMIYYASPACKLSRTMEQYRGRNKGRGKEEEEWYACKERSSIIF